MKLAFFGTPAFAVPSLQALAAAGHDVALVVTQPDRPAGRGFRLTPPPVKLAAAELGLSVRQPERVAGDGFPEALRRVNPEACVVVAFGQKIPDDLLALPPGGWINLHFSFLPRWRGAAPVARAIMAGERVTGVSTIYLDRGWDTGDLILRREVAIDPEEDAGTLLERLGQVGADLLRETITLVAEGRAPRTPQEQALATAAPRLRPEEGELEWGRPAAELHDRVRALSPSPGAYTHLRGKRLKILRTGVTPAGEEGVTETAGNGRLAPGTVVLREGAVYVATGAGLLRLVTVQGEGGRALPAEEFARGRRLAAGERLGGKG